MIAEKKYLRPSTIAEAIQFSTENELDFRYIAGGTDVIVNKFQGNDLSNCLIDITEIPELKTVTTNKNYLKIGSLVQLYALQTYSKIKDRFFALIEAAHSVASPVIRRTATIGGNILCENRCIFYNQSEWWRDAAGYCLKCEGDICIATGGRKNCFSKFVSDTAIVLIAVNAMLEVNDKNGNSLIPIENIYSGNGILPINLPKTALISSILLPIDKEYNCVFKKLRPREAVDFTSLTTAVSIDNSGKMRIVIGGVDPKPVLIETTRFTNQEEIIQQALKRSRIVDNDHYSRSYRREMLQLYLEKSFDQLKKI